MKKPWSGRFKESTAPAVEEFTESVSFDSRLWPFDIQGSIAHAGMLARQGIISKPEAAKIVRGLSDIAHDIDAGKFKFDPGLEDVHMNIEAELTRRIGAAGGKLHTARSRNDQVCLDMRLYLRHECREITSALTSLMTVLVRCCGGRDRYGHARLYAYAARAAGAARPPPAGVRRDVP